MRSHLGTQPRLHNAIIPNPKAKIIPKKGRITILLTKNSPEN